jgi:hypothetical protein
MSDSVIHERGATTIRMPQGDGYALAVYDQADERVLCFMWVDPSDCDMELRSWHFGQHGVGLRSVDHDHAVDLTQDRLRRGLPDPTGDAVEMGADTIRMPQGDGYALAIADYPQARQRIVSVMAVAADDSDTILWELVAPLENPA